MIPVKLGTSQAADETPGYGCKCVTKGVLAETPYMLSRIVITYDKTADITL